MIKYALCILFLYKLFKPVNIFQFLFAVNFYFDYIKGQITSSFCGRNRNLLLSYGPRMYILHIQTLH